MRIKQIENQWQSWQPGTDNSLANNDIPLAESVDISQPTDTVKRLYETSADSFGPAMNITEALEWLKS